MTESLSGPEQFDAAAVTSFGAVLEHWVTQRGDRLACAYHTLGAARNLSYTELDRCTARWGRALAARTAVGDRVAILLPQGLEFALAVLACLRSGRIAVPLFPTRGKRSDQRLRRILDRAEPALILAADPKVFERDLGAADALSPEQRVLVATPAELEANVDAELPVIGRDDPAIVQFTSGSTGDPRGVLLSHGNLLADSRFIYERFRHGDDSCMASWLPLFHDMGLVGGLLQPIYGGFPAHLMPPTEFVAAPARWLQLIDRVSATTSGAPNFAYDVCVDRITPAEVEQLDLQNWSIAFVGGEPVRAATLARFAAHFAGAGLHPNALYPCYGLAEGTLLVTGGEPSRVAPRLAVDRSELADSRVQLVDERSIDARLLVGCGRPRNEDSIELREPDTGCLVGERELGEVWIAGETVGRYWRETGRGLDGPIATGDLGFLVDGELYLAGRVRDLILVRGQNVFPEDLEETAAAADPSLHRHRSAAFGIERGGTQEPMLVLEVRRNERRAVLAAPEAVVSAVRRAIWEEHELVLAAVVLVAPGAVPVTSSGKVARSACRQAYLEGRLTIVHEWSVESAEVGEDMPRQLQRAIGRVAEVVAEMPGVLGKPCLVDRILDLGLDSLRLAQLAGRLEREFDRSVAVAELFENPTIGQLARRLVWQGGAAPRGTGDPVDAQLLARLSSSPIPDGGRDSFAAARANALGPTLARADLAAFFLETESGEAGHATVAGRPVLMLGSMDYLGLASDPRVRAAAAAAATRHGAGRTGSRLHNGTTAEVRKLEVRLAEFFGREAALVFNSGYAAQVGVVSGLLGAGAVLVLDQRAHPSIQHGGDIAHAEVRRFAHNDADSLADVLADVDETVPTLVFVDGIYSAEGDLARLPELAEVCRRFGARIAVDEAHSAGVLGATGRGLEEFFGGRVRADLLSGTFSKAFGSVGGWVAGNRTEIDWIAHHGGSMVFSTAIAPPCVAAAHAALDVIEADHGRIARLHTNAASWRKALQREGVPVLAEDGPIAAVPITAERRCLQLSRRLLDDGIYANVLLAPAVPLDRPLIRTCITSEHRRSDLEAAAIRFGRCWREVDSIGDAPHT